MPSIRPARGSQPTWATLPDDIIAARRADAAGPRRWIAIGIASTAAQAEHYRRLGADIILAHPDELVWKLDVNVAR